MNISFFFLRIKYSPHKLNISAETSKLQRVFLPFNLIFNAEIQKLNSVISFTPSCEYLTLVKRATGKASAWGPRPHFERKKASLVWACRAFERCNQNSIWYADWRQAGAGRPKQTWKKLTEKDCPEWKLTTVDPQEWSTWRSGVRSAMRAASQLPGKGPTDVDDAPAR